jgi:2-polyprenyl-6-methoxyphenol hydroxylase-like FAD-dependent oxidoreductase
MYTDVLIVGAGPTGLMLAVQLARRGVRVRIIDRREGPARETRALGVQARTLEIYSQLGIAKRAIALGKRADCANMWTSGRKMARIPLVDAGCRESPYPYLLVLGQDDNERLLGEKLAEYGVAVQWNTTLLELEQHASHAIATLGHSDGSTSPITATWIAGCDGARSTVREQAGIDFPGAPYEHVFFVADVEAKGTMVPDELNVYLWKDGFHLFFPMRGDDHWRIVGILPETLRDRDDVRFESLSSSLRAEAGASLAVASCSWFSTYRIHHRAAAQFHRDRCFVLGDAAHIHSPVGAQGMNTGLQDAYNLAWKLALVIKGQAEERLLDSYEAERLPVARQLLRTTDRGFRLVVSNNPLAGLMRTQVIARLAAFAMGHERIQATAFRAISQTGIHYRGSRLSKSLSTLPANGPRAGDRFPWLQLRFGPGAASVDLFATLDDQRFQMLVFGQPVPAQAHHLKRLVRVHSIPDDADNAATLARAGIPTPSFYLLRPDGHVGLCGNHLYTDEVERYLSERLGMDAAIHASLVTHQVRLNRNARSEPATSTPG